MHQNRQPLFMFGTTEKRVSLNTSFMWNAELANRTVVHCFQTCLWPTLLDNTDTSPTLPKIVCLLFSSGVAANVKKNWLPLSWAPAFAIATRPRRTNRKREWSSSCKWSTIISKLLNSLAVFKHFTARFCHLWLTKIIYMRMDYKHECITHTNS